MPKEKKHNTHKSYTPGDFSDLRVRRLCEVSLWWMGQNPKSKQSDFLVEIDSYPYFFNKALKGDRKSVSVEMIQNTVDRMGVNADYFFKSGAPMFDEKKQTNGSSEQHVSHSKGTFQSQGDISGTVNVGDTIYNGLTPDAQLSTIELLQKMVESLNERHDLLMEEIKKNQADLSLVKEVAGRLTEPANE